MKKHLALFALALSLFACGTSETKQTTTTNPPQTARPDSVVAAKPQNCQSVVEAAKLGKTDEYSESAKNVRVKLTLFQDESTQAVSGGCYFNNAVEVAATKKSGSVVFRRKLLKDDLIHFTKNDAAVEAGILQKATYIPTFNSQKYITIGLQLTDPSDKKNTSFTVFMNYYGEIVKVK